MPDEQKIFIDFLSFYNIIEMIASDTEDRSLCSMRYRFLSYRKIEADGIEADRIEVDRMEVSEEHPTAMKER